MEIVSLNGGITLFALEALLLAWTSSRMRRNGANGRPVMRSVSTTTLLRDGSLLSTRGRRYRIATAVLFIAMALTFSVISFFAPVPR